MSELFYLFYDIKLFTLNVLTDVFEFISICYIFVHTFVYTFYLSCLFYVPFPFLFSLFSDSFWWFLLFSYAHVEVICSFTSLLGTIILILELLKTNINLLLPLTSPIKQGASNNLTLFTLSQFLHFCWCICCYILKFPLTSISLSYFFLCSLSVSFPFLCPSLSNIWISHNLLLLLAYRNNIHLNLLICLPSSIVHYLFQYL